MNRKLAIVALFLFAISTVANAQTRSMGEHWVSAWSAAVHTQPAFPGLPPVPVLENQTIRMVVRPTISGSRVRVRLSNAFGTTPLKIGAAHIAPAAEASSIVAGSDHALTFNG